MPETEFNALIDELLDLPRGTLTGTALLEDYGWGSLATVGFVGLADEKFGVSVVISNLLQCRTVRDLASLLEGRVSV
jgi:acyl carrier protein